VTACVTYERRVEKPRAASSVGVGRRARLPTPALRTARGFAYYVGTQMLFRVLPFVFPYGFLSKRETARSLLIKLRTEKENPYGNKTCNKMKIKPHPKYISRCYTISWARFSHRSRVQFTGCGSRGVEKGA